MQRCLGQSAKTTATSVDHILLQIMPRVSGQFDDVQLTDGFVCLVVGAESFHNRKCHDKSLMFMGPLLSQRNTAERPAWVDLMRAAPPGCAFRYVAPGDPCPNQQPHWH